MEEIDQSGVWLFRSALLPLAQLETGKGRGRTTQRGRSPVISHALVRMRMGKAPLSGHILESGAGSLLAGMWRAAALDVALVC